MRGFYTGLTNHPADADDWLTLDDHPSRFPMKNTLRSLAFAALAVAVESASAHPDPIEPEASGTSVPAFFLAQAGPPRATQPAANPAPRHRVTIGIEGDQRVIRSNGWPDHEPGAFPRKGNPNTARPQEYTFRVSTNPKAAATPERRGGWFFAVALNGVPFEASTAESWNNDRSSGWRYEAATGFLDLGLDEHHAHVQPTGAYHYHALPTGLVERLGGDDQKMLLVAWAADGFPIYTATGLTDPQNLASPLRKIKPGYRLKTGARPASTGGPGGSYDGRFTEDWEYAAGSGDLDECNGRVGVTPEFPGGTYHYYITAEFPFIPRQWRGTPDQSFAKNEGPPPGARAGGQGGPPPFGGADGRPPGPPIITALDGNGDGEIDTAEINAAAAALRRLDRNGDGKLTPEEWRPTGPRGGPPGEGSPRGPR